MLHANTARHRTAVDMRTYCAARNAACSPPLPSNSPSMVSLRWEDVCVVAASYQGAHRIYLMVSMAFIAHPAFRLVIFAGAEIIG